MNNHPAINYACAARVIIDGECVEDHEPVIRGIAGVTTERPKVLRRYHMRLRGVYEPTMFAKRDGPHAEPDSEALRYLPT
jgi:hypothetical protein